MIRISTTIDSVTPNGPRPTRGERPGIGDVRRAVSSLDGRSKRGQEEKKGWCDLTKLPQGPKADLSDPLPAH